MPPMKKLFLNIGLFTLSAAFPAMAFAASYCGERVCHSYDSSGACNNYTCFGDGYYPPFSRSHDYRYEYDRYDYRNRYYDNDYTYYDRNYRYGTARCLDCYKTVRPYYDRSVRSSYYWDEYYYPRYDDRIYVPKAGYYYRY